MDIRSKVASWVERHWRAAKSLHEKPAFTEPENRKPSGEERALLTWLIQNGCQEARLFAPQIDAVRVVGRCSCGCPTIDFAVDDPISSGIDCPRVLSDFIGSTPEGWQVGVLLHQNGGKLAEMEVYNLSEHEGSFGLPNISTLKPFDA